MKTKNRRTGRGGFTVLELLVVCGVIATLVAILLPAVQQARGAARRVSCGNKIRGITFAATQYADTYGNYPAGLSPATDKDFPFLGWAPKLYPFIEQGTLWLETTTAYKEDKFPFNGSTHQGFSSPVVSFQCPDDNRVGRVADSNLYGPVALNSYVGVAGRNYATRDGVLFAGSRVKMSDITDGLSNTLLFGERPPSADEQYGWLYSGFGQAGAGWAWIAGRCAWHE